MFFFVFSMGCTRARQGGRKVANKTNRGMCGMTCPRYINLVMAEKTVWQGGLAAHEQLLDKGHHVALGKDEYPRPRLDDGVPLGYEELLLPVDGDDEKVL